MKDPPSSASRVRTVHTKCSGHVIYYARHISNGGLALASQPPSLLSKVEHGLSFTAKAVTVAQVAYKVGRVLAPIARAAAQWQYI